MPMITVQLRATLWMPTLFGLMTACASGGARPPAPERSTVTSEDLANNPQEPIERVLQAKVSGVTVKRTNDGGIALQIRGASSFDGSDAPLFLVDDMPMEPGPGGALTGVDPYSIESIKVLKGAEAGIYGIRGMNGVIVITTKKPGTRAP
jgi:TonB-dependent SusC/RagA subfamily outer membrane receptor